MKPLLFIALLAGVGFGVYKFAFASSAAYQAYEKYADAVLYDRWDDARKVCTKGTATEFVDEAEELPKKFGFESYRNVRAVVHMGPFRTVESEKSSSDGKTVTLRVIQEERAGTRTMAPIGKPTVRHKQDVVVVDTADGWRVQGFKEEVEPLFDH
jgi:hypothetical protein